LLKAQILPKQIAALASISGVESNRLLDSVGQELHPVADFLLAEDLKEFFAPSCKALANLLKFLDKPASWSSCRWFFHTLWNLKSFLSMKEMRERQEVRTCPKGKLPSSGLFGKSYYGGLPFRIGPGACKWGLVPRQTHDIGEGGPMSDMKKGKDDTQNFASCVKPSGDRYIASADKFLSNADAVFDFVVQVATDEEYFDLIAPNAIWPEDLSPYVAVGTVTIPKGQTLAKLQNEIGNGLVFSVWNNLKEHQPIGPLNNARHEVYKQHGSARVKAYNQCPYFGRVELDGQQQQQDT